MTRDRERQAFIFFLNRHHHHHHQPRTTDQLSILKKYQHDMLYVGGGARAASHKSRDRASNKKGQARSEERAQAVVAGHRRVGQVDVHQADENHSRLRLLRRGQAHLHQTSLSEHLHGHEFDDPSHGGTQDTV